MYELLLKLHSWWAWLAMLVLFAGIINALMGYGANRDYEEERVILFLSSKAENGDSVKKVSEIAVQFDC